MTNSNDIIACDDDNIIGQRFGRLTIINVFKRPYNNDGENGY